MDRRKSRGILSLVLFSVMLSAGPSASQAGSAVPERGPAAARALIQRMAERAALIKDMQAEHTRDYGLRSPRTVMRFSFRGPGSFRSDRLTSKAPADGPRIDVMDERGRLSWDVDQGVMALKEDALSVRDAMQFSPFTLALAPRVFAPEGSGLSLSGRAEVHARACYLLEVTPPAPATRYGMQITKHKVWVDAEYLWPRRIETWRRAPSAYSASEWSGARSSSLQALAVPAFRAAGPARLYSTTEVARTGQIGSGLVFPTRYRTDYSHGSTAMWALRDIKVNLGLDADLFLPQPPPHVALRYSRAWTAAQYREALKEKPQDIHLRFNLAVALRNTEDDREAAAAVAELERLISQDPLLVAAHRELASVYRRDEKMQKAEAMLKRGLTHLPDSIGLRSALASVYQSQGKHDLAVQVYREILKRRPRALGTRLALARQLQAAGEVKEAAEICRAIALDPSLPPADRRSQQAVDLWIQVAQEQAEPNTVEEALANAASLHADQAGPLLRLGQAQLHAGRPKEALATFGRLNKMPAATPGDMASAARLLSNRSLHAEAAAQYERVLARNPRQPVLAATRRAFIRSCRSARQYDKLAAFLLDRLPHAAGASERQRILGYMLEAYVQCHRLGDMLLVLEGQIAAHPTDWPLYCIKARAHEKREETSQAIAAYERALEYAPTESEVLKPLARAYEAAGAIDRAIERLNKALETDPGLVDLWLFLAQTCRGAGRPKDAEAAADRLLATKADRDQAHAAAARIYAGIDRFDKAIACQKALIDTAAESRARIDHRLKLANMYVRANRKTEARAEYEAILKDPLLPRHQRENAEQELVRLYAASGDVDKAAALCLSRIESAPTIERAQQYWHWMKQAFRQVNKPGALVPLLEKRVSERPESISLLYALADAYSDADRGEKAMGALEQALALAPKDVSVLSRLASRYVSASRSQEAADCYRRLLALQPQSTQYYTQLALALDRLGKRQEALALGDEVMRKSREKAQGLSVAADICERLGEKDKALAHVREAAAVSASLDQKSRYREREARLLDRMGRTADAIKVWEELAKTSAEEWRRREVERNLARLYAKARQTDKAAALYLPRVEKARSAREWQEPTGHLIDTFGQAGKQEALIELLKERTAGRPESPGLHFALGEALQRKGRHVEAAAAFEGLRALMPGDRSVLSRLASAYTSAQNRPKAADCYRRLIELAPTNTSYYQRLASALVGLGKREEAQAIAQQVVERCGASQQVLSSAAYICENARAYDTALVYVRQAARKAVRASQAFDYRRREATLLRRLDRNDEAEKTLRDLLEKAEDRRHRQQAMRELVRLYQETGRPDRVADMYLPLLVSDAGRDEKQQAVYSLVEAYQRQGKSAELAQKLQALIETNPKEMMLHRALARVYAQQNDYARAAQALARAAALAPDDRGLARELADRYRSARDYDRAAEQYRKAIALSPKDYSLYGSLASAYINLGQHADAENVVGEMLEKFPREPSAHATASSAYRQMRRYDDAIREMVTCIDLTTGAPEKQQRRLNLANLYRSAGKLAEAEAEYKALLAASGERSIQEQARRQLMGVLAQSGRFDEVSAFFLAVLLSDDVTRYEKENAIERLVRAYRRSGKEADLIARIETALKQHPKEVLLYRTLARAHVQGRDRARAVAALEKAAELAPENTSIVERLADVCRSAKMHDKALLWYSRAIALSPKRYHLYENLARACMAAGKRDQAVQAVAAMLEKSPHDAGVHRAASRVYKELKQYEDAIRHAQKCMALTTDLRQKTRERLNLAGLYGSANEIAKAEKEYETIVAKGTDTSARQIARRKLLELHARSGRLGIVRNAYIKLLCSGASPTEKRSAVWSLVRAHGKPSERDTLAQEVAAAIQKHPKEVFLYRTLSHVQLRRGRPREAAETLAKALELAPNDRDMVRRIASRYKIARMYPEAAKAYLRAIEQNPSSYSLLSSLADCYVKMGERKEGLATLREMLDKFKNKDSAHSRAAFIYSQMGLHDEAIQHVQRAMDLATNDSTRMSYLLRLADFHRRAGSLDEAEKCCRQAIKSATSSSRRRYAATVLGRVLQDQEFATDAKEDLAAYDGHPDRRVEILDGLVQNARGIRASILIGILETKIRQRPADGDLHEALGRACEAAGQKDRAEGMFEKALELGAQNPELGRRLAEQYQRRGEPEAVIDLYRRTIARRPEAAVLRLQLADALASMGKPADAEVELDEYLKRAGKTAAAYTSAASVYQALGLLDKAVSAATTAVEMSGDEPSRASARWRLVQLHTKAGRTDLAWPHAVALLDGPVTEHARTDVVQWMASSLRTPDASARVAQLEKQAAALETKDGAAPQALWRYQVIGRFRERQKRAADALRAYEKALVLMPDDKATQRAVERLKKEVAKIRADLEAVLQRDGLLWKADDPMDPGLCWAAFPDRVYILDRRTGEQTAHKQFFGHDRINPTCIAFDRDCVWLGTDHGAFKYTRKGRFWSRYAVNGTLVDVPVVALSIGKDRGILFTVRRAEAREETYLYDPVHKKWHAVQAPEL